MKNFLTAILLLALTSCSSLSEKVLVRMDGMDEKPEWATLAKTVFKKDGKLMVVGFTEVSSDSRISAVARVADNNARHEISRNIKNNVAYIFQNMKEGIGDGGDLTRFYGSEVSKNISNGVRTEKRYWEKVQTFDSYGERVFKLRMYSMCSIKESMLRRAISEAHAKNNSLSPEIKQKITEHLSSEITKLQGL
jgi:hypothetical protein